MANFEHGLETTYRATLSIPAYVVVAAAATSPTEALVWNTSTANILGVSLDNVSTGGALAVRYQGRVKLICNASVSAGAIVGPATSTAGYITERANPATTTTAFQKVIGIALQAGSTNAVIEVLLNIDNGASL